MADNGSVRCEFGPPEVSHMESQSEQRLGQTIDHLHVDLPAWDVG